MPAPGTAGNLGRRSRDGSSARPGLRLGRLGRREVGSAYVAAGSASSGRAVSFVLLGGAVGRSVAAGVSRVSAVVGRIGHTAGDRDRGERSIPERALGGGPLACRGGEPRGGPHPRVSAGGPDPGAHLLVGVKPCPRTLSAGLRVGAFFPRPGNRRLAARAFGSVMVRVNGSAGARPAFFRPGFHFACEMARAGR